MNFLKNLKLKTLNFKTHSGFTLIETLVAITILLLMIVGPMEIASKSLYSAFYARDEITAYYLAQEGVEYVRNARDSKYLEDSKSGGGSNWIDIPELDLCIKRSINWPKACKIDTITNDVTDCHTNNPSTAPTSCYNPNHSLNYNTANFQYSYQTGGTNVRSKFNRTILITPIDNQGDNEALVTSKVTWHTGSVFDTPREFEIKERLFNWQR